MFSADFASLFKAAQRPDALGQDIFTYFSLFHQIRQCCNQDNTKVYIQINIKVHNKNSPIDKKT
jgi:hypothetical protein